MVMANGSIRDTAVYSIIAAEWPTIGHTLQAAEKTTPLKQAGSAPLPIVGVIKPLKRGLLFRCPNQLLSPVSLNNPSHSMRQSVLFW